MERFYSFLHKQQRVWKNWFSKTRPQPDSERFINFLGIKLFVQAGGIMDWKAMPGVTCSPRWSTSRNWFRQPAQLQTKCTARSKQMSTVVNFGSDRSVHNDRRKLAGDPRMAFASTSRDYTSEESGSNSYPQKIWNTSIHTANSPNGDTNDRETESPWSSKRLPHKLDRTLRTRSGRIWPH